MQVFSSGTVLRNPCQTRSVIEIYLKPNTWLFSDTRSSPTYSHLEAYAYLHLSASMNCMALAEMMRPSLFSIAAGNNVVELTKFI